MGVPRDGNAGSAGNAEYGGYAANAGYVEKDRTVKSER